MEDNKKLDWIVGLKGLAACVVAFFWHYRTFPMKSSPAFTNLFPTLYAYGGLAVELFYALSGFGMVIGYEDKIKNKNLIFDNYIKKRVGKIYPMFLETLLLTVLINIVLYILKYYGGGVDVYPYFDVYHFFLNILLLQTGVFETTLSFNGSGWYISVLMLLYVSYYFCVYFFCKKDSILGGFYVYFFIAILGGSLYMTGWNSPLLNQQLGRGMVSFYAGCTIAKFNHSFQGKPKFQKIILGLFTYSSLIISYILARIFGYEKVWGNISMIVPTVFVPLLLISILLLPFLQKFFAFRFFKYLGGISMSIYLIHHPLQTLIIAIDKVCNLDLNFSSKKLWLVYFSFIVVIADLNQRFINFTIEKIKKKFYMEEKNA